MALKQAHLLGTYLLLCIGTTGMWMGEPTDTLPYPVVVIVCSVVAYLFVDRWEIVRLSHSVSNAMALVIVTFMVQELREDSTTVLMALAHFLVYLQVAKSFRVKKSSDFWLLYTINGLQVAVSCVLNHRMAFGLILFVYILVAMVVLTLFQLRQHTEEWVRSGGSPEGNPLPSGIGLTSAPGVVSSFAKQLALAWIACLLLALPIFWVVPRSAREQTRQRGLVAATMASRPVTGFSESVSLNELSSVMESDEVVLNVWCRDREGKSAALPPNMLWRGVVLTTYRERGWRGTPPMFAHQIVRLDSPPTFQDGQLELIVEQSRAAGHYLFSPRPVYWVKLDNPSLATFCERTEGRLFVRGPPQLGKRGMSSTSFRLRIGSKDATDDPSTAQGISEPYADLTKKVPAHLQRLRALSAELTDGLSEEQVEEKVDRVVAYLSDLTRFQYSLDIRPVDRNLDPVEDFLFHRKAGHCEYFASSAALLLRAAGVSTRVVNGFKGADFNDTGGFYQVPQLLAHAWVEAYDPALGRWVTVDPTPGEGRERGLAGKRFWPAAIANVMNLSTRIWDRYVMDYSDTDQSTILSGIDVEGIRESISVGIEGLADRLPRIPGLSRRQFLVLLAFLLSLALCLLVLAGGRGMRRWLARRKDVAKLPSSAMPADPTYAQWIHLLSRHGIVRAPSQTQLEFAREVEELLAGTTELRDWRGLPSELTEQFYATRFGAIPVDASNSQQLLMRVKSFARSGFGHLRR